MLDINNLLYHLPLIRLSFTAIPSILTIILLILLLLITDILLLLLHIFFPARKRLEKLGIITY